MYGYRARIGYTSPLFLTEVFTYEFYRVVPEGVTLVMTTCKIVNVTRKEVEDSYNLSIEAAKEMGRNGVDLVVLGGIPVNMARGFDKIDELIKDTEKACGVPVTTSITAQINALRQLKSRKIAVVTLPEPPPPVRPEDDYLTRSGFQVVVSKGIGYGPMELGRVNADVSVRVARELLQQHPEADTVYFPGPHRAIVDKIEAMEQVLGVNVVTASQAIFWEALRCCGINDRIPGFGRLLLEPRDGKVASVSRRPSGRAKARRPALRKGGS
jgi:maleate cis-trans isomerase